jgi:hypothetical protein
MRVQHDPQAPVYVFIDIHGVTETFQLPYRLASVDSTNTEVEVTVNTIDELILLWDQSDADNLRGTLVEIDTRAGTVEKILPRY